MADLHRYRHHLREKLGQRQGLELPVASGLAQPDLDLGVGQVAWEYEELDVHGDRPHLVESPHRHKAPSAGQNAEHPNRAHEMGLEGIVGHRQGELPPGGPGRIQGVYVRLLQRAGHGARKTFSLQGQALAVGGVKGRAGAEASLGVGQTQSSAHQRRSSDPACTLQIARSGIEVLSYQNCH